MLLASILECGVDVNVEVDLFFVYLPIFAYGFFILVLDIVTQENLLFTIFPEELGVLVELVLVLALAFALAVVLALAEYTDFVTEFEITSFLVHVVGSLYICVDILGVKGMALCI